MGVIRIRESGERPDGWNATVSFDYGPEYDISICDPFSEAERQQLEWYFEKYPQYPFKRHDEARNVAHSIASYGVSLFQQIFSENSQVNFHYKAFRQSGLEVLRLEIAGSPKFHALYWEALKDPERSRPLVLLTTIVRQNLTPPSEYAPVRSSPIINLLVVTARPWGKDDPAAYRIISRPLVDSLRNANLHIQIDILRPGTYKQFENHLRKMGVGYYHIIHFDMHGKVSSYEELQQDQEELKCYQFQMRYARQEIQPYQDTKAFLFFESEEDNKADLVEAKELSDLVAEYLVPIVILNACQSGKQAGDQKISLGSYLMQAGVQLVLAISYSMNIHAAGLLMSTLYSQLFFKDELISAIGYARTELFNNKERKGFLEQPIYIEDWLLPVIYQNQTQPLKLNMRKFTDEEEIDYFARKVKVEVNEPEFRYGFFGRDVDILQIEKLLLTRRNVLLIQSMGGAGKTTLLHYLGVWWQRTNFIDLVFYFGYDKRAWTLQQIMNEIALHLFDSTSYRRFQSYQPSMQQTMLRERLHAENHLLILDNLESITGINLSIQNSLPLEEQVALRDFLTRLVDGHTFVLLGSRSSEEWLSKGTFENNVYDLSGLDKDAASALANRILKEQRKEHYCEDEDFHKLLNLLKGFPLAIEVMLANLTRQTPGQILAVLQSGNINQDKDYSQENTESILRCIDYLHSNLAVQLQQLLLCLAPFTNRVKHNTLEWYPNYLRRQSVLANLPFEQWSKVKDEAQNYGLLQPDPENPHIVWIQPILSYLLRSSLELPEQTEKKKAIELAFCQLHEWIGTDAQLLLKSLSPTERQKGQHMVGLEYENLDAALHLALNAQLAVPSLLKALSIYLDTIKDEQNSLKLGQAVLKSLQEYPTDKLAGSADLERIRIIGALANQQKTIGQYNVAATSYQQQLEFLSQIKDIDEEERNSLQATVNHSLGDLVFDQEQWNLAEAYYKNAMSIKISLDNPRSLSLTYEQLSRVAQRQGKSTEAEEYYRKAQQVFVAYNDLRPNLLSQASFYPDQETIPQQYRQSAAMLDAETTHIFRESKNPDYMAKAYQYLDPLPLEEIEAMLRRIREDRADASSRHDITKTSD
jgi:CHAT domain/Tetratricopeptide repeat